MAFTYKTGFKSHSGQEWDILLTDTWVDSIPAPEPDDEYTTRGLGFKLKYHGKDKDPLDPIKSSSCRLEWICKTQAEEDQIDDIYDVDFDDNVYCIIFKGSALYWWGYLQPNVSHKPNIYFSKTYTLEAVDILALLNSQKIYDNIYPGTVHLPALGIDVGVPRHRFGAPRLTQLVSTSSWPKEEPTVVEIIYSLLYDLDHDVGGVLNVIDHWEDTGSSQVGAPPLGRTTLKIWHYLFNDVPASNALGLPIDRRQQVTAYEIMRQTCELFACRIFQRNGEYYLIQPEFYETGTPVLSHPYIKDTHTWASQPVYDKGNRATLTSTDYLTTITSPPVNPFFIGESGWSKLYGLFAVTLTGTATGGGGLDWSVKRKINSGLTNNLSTLSTRDKELTTEYPLAGIKFIRPVSSLPPTNQVFDRNSSGTFYDTYTTVVNAALELRNLYRKIFKAKIKAPDHDFFRALVYDGADYIGHDLTFEANLERWGGQWVEIKAETSDLDEAIGYAPSKGDLNTFINNFILEWIKKRTG